MKIITWNVNGIRSVMCKEKNGTKHAKPIVNNVVSTLLAEQNPDVLCLQEIKCGVDVKIAETLDIKGLGYNHISINCSKARKGYSGVCIISKDEPLNIIHDFGDFDKTPTLNNEGRVLTAEFNHVFVVNVYTPNSKPDLSRLDYRTNEWDAAFRKYIQHLMLKKTVIACGDFNVAPHEIDVNNPKTAKGSHGFTDDERNSFNRLLTDCNMIDTFRQLNPSQIAYSWFSPFAKSRERNKGWRIDHILVAKKLKTKLKTADILGEFYGSDHVPCSLVY